MRAGPFAAGEHALFVDRRGRRYLVWLEEGGAVQLPHRALRARGRDRRARGRVDRDLARAPAAGAAPDDGRLHAPHAPHRHRGLPEGPRGHDRRRRRVPRGERRRGGVRLRRRHDRADAGGGAPRLGGLVRPAPGHGRPRLRERRGRGRRHGQRVHPAGRRLGGAGTARRRRAARRPGGARPSGAVGRGAPRSGRAAARGGAGQLPADRPPGEGPGRGPQDEREVRGGRDHRVDGQVMDGGQPKRQARSPDGRPHRFSSPPRGSASRGRPRPGTTEGTRGYPGSSPGHSESTSR